MCFFFFNDTATTEIYTLSLHDALPICVLFEVRDKPGLKCDRRDRLRKVHRSEEQTSELQSHCNIVCRLLLEKTKIDDRHIIRRMILKRCVYGIDQNTLA